MRNRTRWIICLLVASVAGAGWSLAQTSRDSVSPATLLPASAALYFSTDGVLAHEEAWRQTAAYQSMVESGLADAMQKLLASVTTQAQDDPQAARAMTWGTQAVESLWNHGFSLAVSGSLASPPFAVLVVHEGEDLGSGLTALIDELSRGEANLHRSTVEGRAVVSTQIPDSPAEVAWWTEGGHLVVTAGIQPVQQALMVSSGDQPDITEHRLWNKYSGKELAFEQTSVGWLDFARLRESFGGIPLPLPTAQDAPPVQVNHILETLGLHTLEEIAFQSGFQGRSMRTRSSFVAPGPRTGLLSLADREAITWDDLPPLPTEMSSVWAASLDPGRMAETVLEVVRELAAYGPPTAREQFDQGLQQIMQMIGLDLRTDVLETLGSVHACYNDPGQGVFGAGFAVVSRVEDPARLRESVNHLLDRAVAASDGQLVVERVDKLGRTLQMLRAAELPFAPSVCVDEEWLCVGLSPQIVESFLRRIDGSLPQWEPDDELRDLLADMPQEFVSVSLSDPRPGYQMLLTWGPMVAGMIQTQLRQDGALPPGFQVPFSMSDIPPVELITGPLHVNIFMETVDDSGCVSVAKTSLTGIPMIGGGGGPSVATTGVLVALLLPAVQSAREAARRTQSMNNMRQIGLALHSHHDVHQQFPAGTLPNPGLKPEQRLSWLASLLPYLDQTTLHEELDPDAAWNAGGNEQVSETTVAVFQNPSVTDDGGPANTHYAGCGGLGDDGPTLPPAHRRAGIFAYDRATRLRDITDGTSNTMMVFEVDEELGPWLRGGRSTIRPLTSEPYIHGPDGIGGRHPGGANVLMGDGSVRFLSEDIDPRVMRALATMAGGEAVGEF